ncbi:MAG: rhamnulokinase [Phototrophicaceae bacterium]
MTRKTVLAVDLGAESGRVMAVHFDGQRLESEVLHRFDNPVTQVHGTYYWDVLHLWRGIQHGIAASREHHPASIGLDTWGVDFALLDAQGTLLGNPVMYRDSRTDGMMDAVFARVPRRQVFEQTGVQFMQINTLYQLMSLVESKSPLLDAAHTLLTMPDLFHYWLTGERVGEFTIGSTTQMLNPRTRTWAVDMLARAGIPTHILPPLVMPGTRLGVYDGIPVIAPGAHDTASAVAAVPAQTAQYAYISSGTWSLIGLEVPQAVISDATYAANLTNEGGVENTYRLLKNVTGLWLLQQCRAIWAAEGTEYSYAEMVQLAEDSPPLESLFDVDDARFLTPGDHPQRIRELCAETGVPVPQTHGAIVRAVLESLALRYRVVLDQLREVSGQAIDTIHIVGGGTKNTLLNQLTADATGIPVVTGPVEATVLGNAVIQLIALGELANVAEARQLIAGMGVTETYQPHPSDRWQDHLQRLGGVRG